MIIAATDNPDLNKDIIKRAKRKRIISYSVDTPITSDISFVSIINIHQVIHIAISTSGKSPIMNKIISNKIETGIKKIIDENDLRTIEVQEFARQHIKKYIHQQKDRAKFLYNMIEDREIQKLIRKNNIDKVKDRIISNLEKWEVNKGI